MGQAIDVSRRRVGVRIAALPFNNGPFACLRRGVGVRFRLVHTLTHESPHDIGLTSLVPSLPIGSTMKISDQAEGGFAY